MRTELYSVRSSAEELSFLNKNLRKIVTALDKNASIRVLYKTEIDWNPRKIKSDLIDSFTADNPPELYVYINALDSKDSSSFRYMFSPLIERLEKEFPQDKVAEDGKTRLYPHIKVYPLTELKGDYPAYCFVFRSKKILALPRISLVGDDLISYLCDAVNCARDVFNRAFTECPDGFVYSTQKPETAVSKFVAALFGSKKHSTAQHAEAAETNAVNASASANDSAQEIPTDTVPTSHVASLSEPEHTADSADTEQTAAVTAESDTETEEQSDSKKAGGFKAFIRSFIPMKGDSPKSIVSKIIVLAAIVVFLVAAGMLLNFYVIDPWINSSNMTDIQKIFYEDKTVQTDASGNAISTPDEAKGKNWEGLKEINEEIVGWIKLDKTEIDYPVLYHEGDTAESQFYLYKNYKKEYSDFGSIFLDYRCTEGANSKHVILHGHNMGSDDSMFGSLLQYARLDGWVQGNTKFYKSTPIINYDTPEVEGDWIVFAVMKIDVSNDNKAIFNYLLGDFESEAQYMNFIYNIKGRSYLDVEVPINEDDRILTLSTCSYESDNMRTVVVARQVREGEDVSKYVETVKQAKPQSKVESTFSDEYKEGNITWYDGDGKLDGDESIDYMEQAEMFTVKFVDANGKEISSQKVIKGEDATAPTGQDPRKAADDTYYYTFKGWTPSFKNVTKNLTIKPAFNKHRMPTVEETERATDPPERETQAPVTQAPTKAPTQAATTPVTTTVPTPATTLPADPVENSSAQ